MSNVLNTKADYLSSELGRSDKERLLDFIVGDSILEVGSGSGVVLDLIEKHFSTSTESGLNAFYPMFEKKYVCPKTIVGSDISPKVIKNLKLRKEINGSSWHIGKADALNVHQYYNMTFDTIIFCSVLHEVFSYSQFMGQRYNIGAVYEAVRNAWKILNVGGRIIIRDGIIPENYSDKVVIQFKTLEALNFFLRYQKDKPYLIVGYERSSINSIKLSMGEAMEFLYTYTWGIEAYPCEVQEQYGYFTKHRFNLFFSELFGDDVKIIHFDSYLQDGYKKYLDTKVCLEDINGNTVAYPHSNCIVVAEKLR